ncbi:MAG TPA: YbhB/YbcL family Raf kinase inhibitor-like protein, partial [Syntrophales bacterium]|nr:YbhB/YbcL family Raf kinase inhibitor-like protein [Syntrophales bacterium]
MILKERNLLEIHLEKRLIFFALIIAFFLVFVSCSKSGNTTKMLPVLEVKSQAFGYAKSMSDKYTCDGADISPPLEWKNAPVGTKTFAVICETPDAPAGNWVQWLIYDIPADVTKLPESVAKKEKLEN